MEKEFRCNNKEARRNVIARVPFSASNMYGRYTTAFNISRCQTERIGYAVFSYGDHFPMYVYDYEHHVWIGNEDKYSVSTSRHQSQANPGNVSKWVDTNTIKRIVLMGITDVLIDEITHLGKN